MTGSLALLYCSVTKISSLFSMILNNWPLFFSTFYFNLMKLCYIALLITPIMTGINNLCPVIIVK